MSSYTAPTTAEIRERWPYLTSTVIGDSSLETLRASARERVRDDLSTTAQVSGGMSPATEAWLHMTAHLATLRARTTGTATAGPLSAASYQDRSKTFGGGAAKPAARGSFEARLYDTDPGQEYLSLVSGLALPPFNVTPQECW